MNRQFYDGGFFAAIVLMIVCLTFGLAAIPSREEPPGKKDAERSPPAITGTWDGWHGDCICHTVVVSSKDGTVSA